MIQDVKVLGPELQFPSFGKRDVFGELHIPTRGPGQTKWILADVAKGPKNGRVVDGFAGVGGIRDFGRLKRRRCQPAHALGFDAGT